jgi:hypothetical protein
MTQKDTTDGRIARLEEAFLNLSKAREEDRSDAKEAREVGRADRAEILAEIKDLKGITTELSQTVTSTGNAIRQLSLEKCGERLDGHDGRIDALENKTKNLPIIETEVMFWRRVLGGGFRAIWKIIVLIVGSGAVGGAITKIIWPH